MTMELECFECGACVGSDTLEGLGDTLLHHARSDHEWPFPDQGIRNYAEATQRLVGPSERLDEIGEVEVHPVTPDRLDDWRMFMDHDAFVGTPEWAACYCIEPHVRQADESPGADEDVPHWRENREASAARIAEGTTVGYLAYVDGKPAGWVNASLRSQYTLHVGAADDPPGDETIGLSCFLIAPPFRRHGLAAALLDRVIANAPERGARWVEAYPFPEAADGDDKANFRGPRALFEQQGFEEVRSSERVVVLRKELS